MIKIKLIHRLNFLITYSIALLLGISLLTGCYEHFPYDQDISRTQNEFLNQDSVTVKFPAITKGKITLMAMVYTHCPDICPMTTHNMFLADNKLPDEIKKDVNYVVISFDPNRDTPSVLKKFAEIRDLSFDRWTFLTGNKKNTDEVMLKFDVKAIPVDSSYDDEGNLTYYVIHTDRISLIDKEGKLRKNYKGSTADINEIVEDIKYLE